MQRRQINAVIDLALLVLFPIVVLTSVVLFFFLPSGGGGGAGHFEVGAINLRVFLGLTRGTWVDLHTITGLIFMVLMAVHIILHIPYYRTIRRCLSGSRNEKCDRE